MKLVKIILFGGLLPVAILAGVFGFATGWTHGAKDAAQAAGTVPETVYVAPVTVPAPAGPQYVQEEAYEGAIEQADAWKAKVECARSWVPDTSGPNVREDIALLEACGID